MPRSFSSSSSDQFLAVTPSFEPCLGACGDFDSLEACVTRISSSCAASTSGDSIVLLDRSLCNNIVRTLSFLESVSRAC